MYGHKGCSYRDRVGSDSDAFLAALDRFVARQVIPSDLYSDCGTNYVGTARQLKRLFNDESVQNKVSNHVSCNWHFNPPAVPHFGGLWEAAIKSVKSHLKHVLRYLLTRSFSH